MRARIRAPHIPACAVRIVLSVLSSCPHAHRTARPSGRPTRAQFTSIAGRLVKHLGFGGKQEQNRTSPGCPRATRFAISTSAKDPARRLQVVFTVLAMREAVTYKGLLQRTPAALNGHKRLARERWAAYEHTLRVACQQRSEAIRIQPARAQFALFTFYTPPASAPAASGSGQVWKPPWERGAQDAAH